MLMDYCPDIVVGKFLYEDDTNLHTFHDNIAIT